MANSGDVLAPGGGADLTIDGGVTNAGRLSAFGGSLTITGTVSGTGTVAVSAAGVLDIGGALTEAMSFAANSTGELILGDSHAFARTIKGFSTTGANRLDLGDIAFKAGTNSRTLRAHRRQPDERRDPHRHGWNRDSANRTGRQLHGLEVHSSPIDSHGGTVVTDPMASASPRPS